MKIYFGVNEYDEYGDLVLRGIYLHFGDTRVKVADDMRGYEDFINKLIGMKAEIKETLENLER